MLSLTYLILTMFSIVHRSQLFVSFKFYSVNAFLVLINSEFLVGL